MNKKITMNDIAKEAGVAKSTVSRYFNDGYVKEDTRKKIQKVIERYQYEPNASAQALKSKETKTIGIVCPTLDSVTAGKLIMSMDGYLKEHGYTVLIIETNHDANDEIRSLEYFRSIRVDGIILVATNLNLLHQRIVAESEIPILIVAQHFKNGCCIIYDDYRAGYEAGKLVAEKGHKNVLYLGVSRNDDAVGVQRRKGVIEGLENSGVERIHTRESDFSVKKARKIIDRYLVDHHPTCIICATDNMALAALKTIQEKGLKVPEDISLVGFGGYEIGSLTSPTLCSFRFDYELAGKLAGSTILQLIRKEPVASTQMVGYEFIPGDSLSVPKKI